MTQDKANVLIVDDHQPTRDAIARGLSQFGYKCHSVEGAEDATGMLEVGTFDLMLLDIEMPGKTGLELLPEIHENYPDLAIVMLTGTQDIETGVKAMRDGAFDYVTKPVSLSDLLIRIERALERQTLIKQNSEYHQQMDELVDQLGQRLADPDSTHSPSSGKPDSSHSSMPPA